MIELPKADTTFLTISTNNDKNAVIAVIKKSPTCENKGNYMDIRQRRAGKFDRGRSGMQSPLRKPPKKPPKLEKRAVKGNKGLKVGLVDSGSVDSGYGFYNEQPTTNN